MFLRFILFTFLSALLFTVQASSQSQESSDCDPLAETLLEGMKQKTSKQIKKQKRLDRLRASFIGGLNTYLNDPEYRVLILGRHGHAIQEHKEKVIDPVSGKKVPGPLDRTRDLDERGKRDVKNLTELMSDLGLQKSVVFVSDAVRVEETGRAIYAGIQHADKKIIVDKSLYYTETVLKDIFQKLLSTDYSDTRHAIYVGHGKTTMQAFKTLSGSDEAVNPTAGVMAIAIKTSSWQDFKSGVHNEVHVFAMSPKGSHMTGLESAQTESLESYMPGQEEFLESATVPRDSEEEMEYAEFTRKNFSWDFE